MTQYRRRVPKSAPIGKTADSPCNRGCCWTPYGCGHQKKCECHREPIVAPDWAFIEKKMNNE